MRYGKNRVDDIKIAYIGGGSRGWAWGLMSDLAEADDICGTVALYDIDYGAAQNNEIIGNNIVKQHPEVSPWKYQAVKTIGEALTGADFVVISILPGTFDEMESDVHTPEKYGIYQSVGDTTGPGGIVRALRTVPMFEEIALAIKEYCPKAWVINYTNPMTLCVRALYQAFPEIKAFGCCHEVFSTQKLLAVALKDICSIEGVTRDEIKVNVVGINHYTWLTSAHYQNIDLFPIYRKFAEKYQENGFDNQRNENWLNRFFRTRDKVKLDLFLRYGIIAAAGDRHLAEFSPGGWYIKDPQTVESWEYRLTPVSWRKDELKERLRKSAAMIAGEEGFELKETGEDGVKQIRALLGLGDLVTNVNLPNTGQIPNLPLDAVVETNAVFTSDTVTPVQAGMIPEKIYSLIARVVGEQECIAKAANTRNLSLAFEAFLADPLVRISIPEAYELFCTMLKNTSSYLSMYPVEEFLNTHCSAK